MGYIDERKQYIEQEVAAIESEEEYLTILAAEIEFRELELRFLKKTHAERISRHNKSGVNLEKYVEET